MKKTYFKSNYLEIKKRFLLHSVSLRKADLWIFLVFQSQWHNSNTLILKVRLLLTRLLQCHTPVLQLERQAPPSCAAAVKGSSRGSLTRACSRWGAGGAIVVVNTTSRYQAGLPKFSLHQNKIKYLHRSLQLCSNATRQSYIWFVSGCSFTSCCESQTPPSALCVHH